MKSAPPNKTFIRREQDFEIYVLQNENLEISLVPELGAKIISLVNRRTGREWMNCPESGFKLFGNQLGDDFASSTLIGWDECLPTIAPCTHNGRSLPDHGEVWSVPWIIDRESFGRGALKTFISLAVSPFYFERSITLHGNEVHLDYGLKNLGNKLESYLWAMHPLAQIYTGDTLELTTETRELLVNPPWLASLDFRNAQPACAKVYAGPLREGRASIKNPQRGDRLTFLWDAKVNHTLGLWLTRGGWNGQHHLALEPSNGSPDSLSEASDRKQCGTIQPRDRVNWRVIIQIEPAIVKGY